MGTVLTKESKMDISIHRVTGILLKNAQDLGGKLEYTRKIVISSKTLEGEPTETVICLFGTEDVLELSI